MNGNSFKLIGRKNFTELSMLLLFALLFVISVGFLSWKIDSGLDPDIGKDWWTVSFETRDRGSLDFSVDNHGSDTRFTYTISQNQSVLENGTVEISKGARKTVSPKAVSNSPGRVTITVEATDGSRKSVYR